MDYTEFKISFKSKEPINDVIKSELNEIGFESFVDYESGYSAFIPSNLFSEIITLKRIENYKSIIDDTEIIDHPYQNWNEKWESSFNPIEISDNCIIRTSFHEKTNVQFDIVINPEMSFGTGHHETTQLMAKSLLSHELNGKSLLDMGTGTGVLAILAEFMGANSVDAIELDSKVYENSIYNGKLNNCSKINFINGSGVSIKKNTYDYILVNINRNSILEEFKFYASAMEKNSIIILSGFYKSDMSSIQEKGRGYGLKYLNSESLNEWTTLTMKKI